MLNVANHQGNVNQNHNEMSPHTCQNGCFRKEQIASAGENVEKREPSCAICGNVNWCSHYGKQNGVSPKKLKIELSYNPAIPLLGIYLK